jgi:hypothetical protein
MPDFGKRRPKFPDTDGLAGDVERARIALQQSTEIERPRATQRLKLALQKLQQELDGRFPGSRAGRSE